MKRATIISVTMVIALMVSSSATMADMPDLTTKVQVWQTSGYYSGNGGEFTLKTIEGWPNDQQIQWQSFCMEDAEYLTMGGTYYAEITTSAFKGGETGPEELGYDPLDPRTAYLYNEFLGGEMSSYDYTPSPSGSRPTSAANLQRLIWFIEEEVETTTTDQQTEWLAEAETAVAEGGSWYEEYGADSIGPIRVLNMYGAADRSVLKQDLLVKVVDGSLVAPVPAALVLGSIGLGIIALTRKRRRA